ncbi:MAG: thiamine/molybdopterin biosynthesis protein [Proteobacteria bacterium]|nr:MAG: thiamine/molybdopterin biosynthesis protein [Pseudomonadota bacterium]
MNDLSRQSFLGIASDRVLSEAQVAIIGLCGGGSHVAQQLAHIGVERFFLCDPDRVEDSNLNRMVGASRSDAHAARPKVDVVSGRISAINPDARIAKAPKAWQGVAQQLRASTAVFGCVDSFSERSQLEAMCRRFLIPYIDIGMDVAKSRTGYTISGQVILSMPGYPCMRCLGFITDELLVAEAQQYGAAGGRPQVVWPNGVLASTAVGLFVSMLLPWHSETELPLFLEYDGNAARVFHSNRLQAIAGMICDHYAGLDDLGDPFYGRTDTQQSAESLDHAS